MDPSTEGHRYLERQSSLCIAHDVNPRAYLHKVVHRIVHGRQAPRLAPRPRRRRSRYRSSRRYCHSFRAWAATTNGEGKVVTAMPSRATGRRPWAIPESKQATYERPQGGSERCRSGRGRVTATSAAAGRATSGQSSGCASQSRAATARGAEGDGWREGEHPVGSSTARARSQSRRPELRALRRRARGPREASVRWAQGG
jgi:hypothetical protein